MKKLFYLFVIVFTTIGITACSEVLPSPSEVANKINNGQQLDIEDYHTMVDYLENFCDAGEESDNTYESGAEVAREHPYFMMFALQLDNAPEEIKNSSQYQNVRRRFFSLMQR